MKLFPVLINNLNKNVEKFQIFLYKLFKINLILY